MPLTSNGVGSLFQPWDEGRKRGWSGLDWISIALGRSRGGKPQFFKPLSAVRKAVVALAGSGTLLGGQCPLLLPNLAVQGVPRDLREKGLQLGVRKSWGWGVWFMP